MARIALTKNDMARVIVQALYLLKELPSENHRVVLNMAKRSGKQHLTEQHKLALEVIYFAMKNGTLR